MKHEIPHDLEMAQAKLVARKAVESYAERFAQYGLEPKWNSDTHVQLNFDVRGRTLEGSLSVLPEKLIFEMEVPFIFKLFTGKATELIDRETRIWIDRAKSGELDAAE